MKWLITVIMADAVITAINHTKQIHFKQLVLGLSAQNLAMKQVKLKDYFDYNLLVTDQALSGDRQFLQV